MDPIANMIIGMKNGSRARKESVVVPYSKIKAAIGECLKKAGFISDCAKRVKKSHPVLEIQLTYLDQKPKITEVERISKQSRRVYYRLRDIHLVRNGTKGILSGKDARKEQVGGEALFKIW